MKRVLKFLGVTMAVLVVLIAAIAVVAQQLSERKAHRKVDFKITALPMGNASIEQGIKPNNTAEKFAVMMRTAKRPDGCEVSKVMPFDSLKLLTDVDLQALHAYLKTLRPRDAGNR